MEEKKRLLYPDVLRIVSTFSVVIIHVIGKLWTKVPLLGADWFFLTSIDSLCRFAVPVFVMVSGMFMLSSEKDRGLKDLYFNKILRLAISFLSWSALYIVLYKIPSFITHKQTTQLNCIDLLNLLLKGKYHLWFIPMIIGLYIVTPILKKIVSDKKSMQYFLIVWFVFCIMKNFINLIPVIGNSFYNALESLKLSMAVEYSGYYILGYYLHNFSISKKAQRLFYILSCLTVPFFVITTAYSSYKASMCIDVYLEYLLPMTLFQSIAVFIFVKNKCENKNPSEKTIKAIGLLSKISFGVYLSHVLIMDAMFYLCVTIMSMPSFASFFIILFSTLILSTAASYILNKIPIVKKYLV